MSRSFLAALTPSVSASDGMTFADVVDEVHRLREENATLKAQVKCRQVLSLGRF